MGWYGFETAVLYRVQTSQQASGARQKTGWLFRHGQVYRPEGQDRTSIEGAWILGKLKRGVPQLPEPKGGFSERCTGASGGKRRGVDFRRWD